MRLCGLSGAHAATRRKTVQSPCLIDAHFYDTLNVSKTSVPTEASEWSEQTDGRNAIEMIVFFVIQRGAISCADKRDLWIIMTVVSVDEFYL